MHGLETGMTVTFREINGMTALNGSHHEVKGESEIGLLFVLFSMQFLESLLVAVHCCIDVWYVVSPCVTDFIFHTALQSGACLCVHSRHAIFMDLC